MSRSRRRTTEEDDLEEIRKGFEMFDTNGTGVIDPAELLEAMDAMNMKEKNPSMYEIIESLNSEKEFRLKGGIKLDELVNYVYNKVNDTESNVGIRQIYDVINDRDTDTISMSTFYTLARDYGDQLSEDEIRYLLEKTQMGGSELNFDEFYTIMKGAVRTNTRKNSNNSYMNMSRSSNKSNDIYGKRGNSTINSKESNRRIRTKKYIYEEPKQPEPTQPVEGQYVEQVGVPTHQEEVHIEVEVDTTTKAIPQNNEDDIPNYQNNPDDGNNNNNNLNQNEINQEIEENKESQNDYNTPYKYSYRKVHIGSTPKYERASENHVELEEDNNNNIEENLKINEINDNDGGLYKKEKETKITKLPDGGKQVEITEKTEITRPYVRSNRYRYSKKSEDKESEEDKKEEKNTYYRIRRPRGEKNGNDLGQVSVKKVEGEDNNEVIIPKRYHRRYRDSKNLPNNDN